MWVKNIDLSLPPFPLTSILSFFPSLFNSWVQIARRVKQLLHACHLLVGSYTSPHSLFLNDWDKSGLNTDLLLPCLVCHLVCHHSRQKTTKAMFEPLKQQYHFLSACSIKLKIPLVSVVTELLQNQKLEKGAKTVRIVTAHWFCKLYCTWRHRSVIAMNSVALFWVDSIPCG